jgi:hypothetical protein
MKTTTTIRSTLIALCLGLFACNPSIGETSAGGTETDGGTGNNPTSGGSEGEWQPCNAGNPCPDGQFCFNGICALGCNSDGDCANDQYCATEGDRLCHNKEVTTCPEVACAEGQVCVNGFCSTPPPATQCEPFAPEDGCEKNALCLEVEEGMAKCYSFPYCPADGVCPVGLQGAVCNNDLIPGKDKICLVSACLDVSHCPSEFKCVMFEGDPLGYCSSGAFGEPCNGPGDCNSNVCDMPFPGFPGFCA